MGRAGIRWCGAGRCSPRRWCGARRSLRRRSPIALRLCLRRHRRFRRRPDGDQPRREGGDRAPSRVVLRRTRGLHYKPAVAGREQGRASSARQHGLNVRRIDDRQPRFSHRPRIGDGSAAARIPDYQSPVGVAEIGDFGVQFVETACQRPPPRAEHLRADPRGRSAGEVCFQLLPGGRPLVKETVALRDYRRLVSTEGLGSRPPTAGGRLTGIGAGSDGTVGFDQGTAHYARPALHIGGRVKKNGHRVARINTLAYVLAQLFADFLDAATYRSACPSRVDLPQHPA